jgi:Ca2+-binding RTX toxin-like protein
LTVLEKFFGEAFVGVGGSNPNVNAAALLNQSYRGIFEMFYAGLMTQTHLKDLYSKISYTWDEATQSLRGDLLAAKTELETLWVQDPITGESLAGEFIRSVKGFQAEAMVGLDVLRSNREFSWLIDSYGFLSLIDGTNNNDTMVGTATGDGIRGGGGNDIIYGGDGNDLLHGQSGDDVLDGGSGVDTLVGGLGNDTLGGVAYSSDWYGYGGGNIYEGGPGNDLIQGTASADVYKFNLGDGQDVIIEGHSGYPYGVSPYYVDVLKIGSGILPSDIEVVRSGYDLVLRHVNGTDRVTVQNWFWGSWYHQLEQVEFSDGTVWDYDYIRDRARNVVGTDASETITTYEEDDRIQGLGGNDTIFAGLGNDLLNGGSGNDYLAGQDGNDTLDGGSGDDYLNGGRGNDLYLFGRGSGQDTINDYDTTLGNTDVVRFSSDILPSDVRVSRVGSYLYFEINGTVDRLIVSDYFSDDLYKMERIEFGDGTVWDSNYVRDRVRNVVGTDASETLTTYEDDDRISSLGGNDTIYAGSGNDLLEGGSGDDTLYGEDGDDTLDGGDGNDILDGGPGVDTLMGGLGNNIYVLDNIGDIVTEALNEGNDTVQSPFTYILGSNIENLILTGTTAINGTGNELNNVLTGNSSANILDGGGEADSMAGGSGNDTYIVDNPGDTVTENSNQGTDIIQSSVSFTLPANVENLTLTGTSSINGTGNTLNNVLIGNSADNILNGGTGADNMSGGGGNDTYVVDNTADVVTEGANQGTDTVQSYITYTLGSNVENLTLMGTSALNGTGNNLNNVITGNSGANTLNGGMGADTMVGGAGNDTYVVDNTGDIITENLNQGTDTVQSSITYTLGPNLENLTLTGTSAINGTGNELNNVLTGNSAANVLTGNAGNDTLNGGAGADTLMGGLGNDTYVVDDPGDIVTENLNEGTDTVQSYITYTLGANFENLTLMGTSAINGTGNELNYTLTGNSASNSLTGGAGNDTLNGGAGADTMVGGAGNDTYVVDNTGDIVTEALNEGTDTIQTSITYTLGPNVENLTLTGSGVINGTGNELNNTITGNSASNILGGGLGNDTYVVGAGDTVIEAANEGTDTVQSSITFALSANVENLTLTGSSAINGTGNGLGNTLTGNSAANILTGGAGNDTYVVGSSDTVIENVNEGVDVVQSSVTFTLGTNVENLTLTGSSAINGTGNMLDNLLTGNSAVNILTGGTGNDTLNGGTGADTLIGGLGNDTLVVDNTGDVVTEAVNEGTDTVQSSITYTLGANVENLTLSGSSAINGTGNALDNVLTGNSGANILTGRAGNDTYIVGSGDTVVENANEGIDTIQSSITYALGANIENLTLTGTSAVNGTGNTLDNILTGNSGTNVLTGNAGNDALDGGVGNDSLNGGTGNDLYLFGRGYGQDTINDYDTTSGNTDNVKFNSGLNPIDLIFVNNLNNLNIQLYNGSDQLTVQNQNLSSAYQVETFEASNGRRLVSSYVGQLIQAMAEFSSQTGMSWTQLIENRPQDVQTILAQYWQPSN